MLQAKKMRLLCTTGACPNAIKRKFSNFFSVQAMGESLVAVEKHRKGKTNEV